MPNISPSVIYHGVDTRVFRPLPNRSELKSHARFRGKFVVGCVARNQPRKNLPALVEAFSKCLKKVKEMHLIMHTDPCDTGADLITLLKRFKLEGNADVCYPGIAVDNSLLDEQLNRLYNVFDVTALPTAGEGFGLPIIESLAAGVPVIATNCSACSELVSGHGELVRVAASITLGSSLISQAIIDVDDLAGKIILLYEHPSVLKSYSTNGLRYAHTLTWDLIAAKWKKLLLSL